MFIQFLFFFCFAFVFINLIFLGAVLAVLYGGAHLISSSELDPGGLMSFLASAQMIQRSLGQLSIVFGHAIKGWSAAARVFEVCFQQYRCSFNFMALNTFICFCVVISNFIALSFVSFVNRNLIFC